MSETQDEASQRYYAAMHAMQSGIAGLMTVDGGPEGNGETSPKHMRVGVNSAMVSNEALARVLVDKGLITEHEMVTALADAAEARQRMYEDTLSAHFGKPVKLR